MSIEKYDRQNKYVDLKLNGRLFPSWINLNFKKYKLDEILNKSDDPCNIKTDNDETKMELKKYQSFIGAFMSYNSPYKEILIYHTVGSGKTLSTLNVYNVLYNSSPAWNVFILIKASLKGGWLEEIKLWLSKDEYEHRFKNINFISYDSPIAEKTFIEAIKNVDNSKKNFFIIEEVHNFIRNVYSNISTGEGRRAQTIYDYIVQDKRENPDTRILLLSGTPAINKPFELALLFNLLRPNSFPKSESEFNRIFVSTGIYQTLNKNSKNLFQRRVMGLVSYYNATTPGVYASKTVHYVDVQMSDYQDDIYAYFEDIETKIALASKTSTVYKIFTRQAVNFVFPPLSQEVNGELRPRPSKFRLSEREATKLAESGEVKDKDKGKLMHLSEYLKRINLFVKTFDDYLGDRDASDRKANYSIIDDIKIFLDKYEGDFAKFHIDHKKKSTLYLAMYTSSPKMTNIIFNIMKSKGPTVVYSNFVLMEGLEMFKIYLKYLGFYNYMIKKELQMDKVGYTEFHGGIKELQERFDGMKAFNNPDNKLGNLLKIMLISPAGAEGLNLKNVRQVHIMEPYWNEVRITQIIGRGIRQCSHKDLPMDQRHVDVYRYKMVRKAGDKLTTDQYIEDVARGKEGLIQSFLDATKEVAIDCNLFKAHNMLSQEYKCFQFDEPSLFDKHIGPAYREDIGDDIKIDNGSNSTRSTTIKIKVMKIKAVKLLSEPDSDKPEYSKPEQYWMYPKSGVVYDYDMHFAVGRISMDDTGALLKLDKDVYIMDYVIPIPTIED